MATIQQVEREDEAGWQAMMEEAMRVAVRGAIERAWTRNLAAAVGPLTCSLAEIRVRLEAGGPLT